MNPLRIAAMLLLMPFALALFIVMAVSLATVWMAYHALGCIDSLLPEEQ